MHSFGLYFFSYTVATLLLIWLPVNLIDYFQHTPIDFFGHALTGWTAAFVSFLVLLAFTAAFSVLNWYIMKLGKRLSGRIPRKMNPFTFYFFTYTVVVAAPLFLIPAILGFFHVATAHFNGRPVYNWRGALMWAFFTPLFGLYLAGVNWIVMKVGSKVYGFFAEIW